MTSKELCVWENYPEAIAICSLAPRLVSKVSEGLRSTRCGEAG